MGYRLGSKLKRLISEGKGASAQRELLGVMQISESEIGSLARPNTRASLAKRLDAVRDMDIMDLWEGLIGSVRTTCFEGQDWNNTAELMKRASHKAALGMPLEEAEVQSNMFQLLTQAKLFTTMMATYELTAATYEAIFETFDSPYGIYDHQIPSDAPEVEFVKEGEEYKTAPLGDRFCQTKANKFGRIIELTRETMITDKTGQVVEQAMKLAESAKYREDQLAALAFQDSANSTLIRDAAEADAGAYYPERTRKALYRTSAVAAASDPRGYERMINQVTGANNLLQWDNIAKALWLMRAATNNQGQLIEVTGAEPLKIIVPYTLEQRAAALTALGGMARIDTNAAAGTESSLLQVPDFIQKNFGIRSAIVIPWRLLTAAATASQSVWYLGGLTKRMWRAHRRWDTEFTRASPAQLGGDDFKRDVITKVRGGFNKGFRCVDDKYTVKSQNS